MFVIVIFMLKMEAIVFQLFANMLSGLFKQQNCILNGF